jgi:hypothetical protein
MRHQQGHYTKRQSSHRHRYTIVSVLAGVSSLLLGSSVWAALPAPQQTITNRVPSQQSASPAQQPAATTSVPGQFSFQRLGFAITNINPTMIKQGDTVTLTVTGSRLDLIADSASTLSMGPGVTVIKRDNLSPNYDRIQLMIAVDVNARPGPRPIHVTRDFTPYDSQTIFTVLAVPHNPLESQQVHRLNPNAAVLSTLTIDSMLPNNWLRGKHYHVNLSGQHFASGMQIQFAAGIHVLADPVVISPNLATFDVDVANDVAANMYPVQWRLDPQSDWNTSNVMAWVLSEPHKAVIAPATVKFTPLSMSFTKGRIDLVAPEWGNTGGELGYERGVPLLDDDIVFEWREQNPGTAEYFELHLLDHANHIVSSQRIEAKNTYFRPDVATVLKALGQLGGAHSSPTLPPPATGQVSSAGGIAGTISSSNWLNAMRCVPKLNETSKQAELRCADLYWEVVGFRTYSKQGVAITSLGTPASALTAVETERSDKWPLSIPDRPNGFQSCPVDGNRSGLALSAPARIGDAKTEAGYYTGDDIVLGGRLTLARSPYRSHPEDVWQSAPAGGGFKPYVNEYRFDNLFIDWGDGTVEPLAMNLAKDSTQNRGPYSPIDTLSLPVAGTHAWDPEHPSNPNYPPNSLHHQYNGPGSYSIKVYQLPESDIQNTAPPVSPGLSQTTAMTSVQRDALSASQLYYRVGSIKQMQDPRGDHAYVLYCHELTIEQRKDTQALGQLQLVSVSAPVFPGHEDLGAGGASTAKTTRTLRKLSSNPNAVQTLTAAQQQVPGVCSACDKSLSAKAILMHIGEGDAVVTWHLTVDGKTYPVGSQTVHIPPSAQRTGNPVKWGDPKPSPWELDSPVLPVDGIGKTYQLRVEVRVKPTSSLTLDRLVTRLNQNAIVRAGSAAVSNTPSDASVRAQGSMLIGLVRPSLEVRAGQPSVVYVKPDVLNAIAQTQNAPPDFVRSPQNSYKVVASDPSLPCQFAFPTQEGKFDIYVNQHTLTHNADGSYSGDGHLVLNLTTSSTGAIQKDITLQFRNWSAAPDGTLAAGTQLATSQHQSWPAANAGVNALITQVQGVAGAHLSATLNVGVSDARLHKPGATTQVQWNHLSAVISPKGNWYHAGLVLPETAIGVSGYHVLTSNAAVDLSTTQGNGPGDNCGSAGSDFVGVNLGDATLIPNTAQLVSLKVPVANWVVQGNLCGSWHSSSPPLPRMVVGKGAIAINKIDANFANGNTIAYYDMDVEVPWLNTTLSGNAVLREPADRKSEIDFSQLSHPSVEADAGPVHLHAQHFRFGSDLGGWRTLIDGELSFKDGNQLFLDQPVKVNNIHLGLNGRVYFDDQGTTSLNQKMSGIARMAQAMISLNSLDLIGHDSGAGFLDFAFHGDISISKKNSIPASPVQVNYTIASDYTGMGPFNSPFVATVVYPPGNPKVRAAIAPIYKGNAAAIARNQTTTAQTSKPLLMAISKPLNFGNNPADAFAGTIDLGMFGGPPMTGEFRLGYINDSDYWITRVTIPLGPTGISLAPLPLSIFQFTGGLGFNMPDTAFHDSTSLWNAVPAMDAGMSVNAGLRIGTTDDFAFVMNGQLVINESTGVTLFSDVWVLTHSHDGPAPLKSKLTASSNGLDFKAYTGPDHLQLLEGAAILDLGTEDVPRVDAHFGDNWHVYAGTKANPVDASFMGIVNAKGFMTLSDAGFMIGADEQINLQVGDDSDVAKAYVSGQTHLELGITPQPRIAGEYRNSLDAGACANVLSDPFCVNVFNTDILVHAEAPPVDMRAHVHIHEFWMPFPLDFTVHLPVH